MHNRSVPTTADYEKKLAHYAEQQQEKRSGSLSGLASCGGLDRPQRDIPATIGELFGLTDQLSESIARLGHRLEPVMIQQPCGKDCASVAGSSTEMGGQLSQIASRVDLMINAVNALDAQLQI